MRLVGLTAIVLVLAASAAKAREGSVYAKLSYQHKGSNQYAQPDGTIFNIPDFVQDDAFFYLAYGLSDRWTVSTSLSPVRSSDLDDSPDELQRASGFGDVQVGAAYRVGRLGAWSFQVGGILQAPTGNENLSGGLQAAGSGVWEGAAILNAGRSLPSGKGYGSVEVGPYFRGGGLRDGFMYRGQLSVSMSRRLSLTANVNGLQRWSETPGTPDPGSPVGFGDGVTYVAVGPSAILKLNDRVGVQGDWEAIFHARNIGTGHTFRFGLFYQR